MKIPFCCTESADFFGLIILTVVVCLFLSSSIINKILCLIGFFVSMALITLTLGADFLAALFLIIYVGAIAVLFLFIIMLLDIKIVPENSFYLKIIANCAFSLFIILCLYFSFNSIFTFAGSNAIYQFNYIHNFDDMTNAGIFGLYLFDDHVPSVLLIGYILLVALVGCIGLTINYTPKRTPEVVSRKLSRRSNTISLFN